MRLKVTSLLINVAQGYYSIVAFRVRVCTPMNLLSFVVNSIKGLSVSLLLISNKFEDLFIKHPAVAILSALVGLTRGHAPYPKTERFSISPSALLSVIVYLIG